MLNRRTLLAAPALIAWRTSRAQSPELQLHGLNRLGWGPRPGDLERAPGWAEQVEIQLQPEALTLSPALQTRLDALSARQRPLGELAEAFRETAKQARGEDDKSPHRQLVRQTAMDAHEARLLRALESPRQLEERLVDFWFNHFNVFQNKGLCRVLVGDYEAQAIRPHVFGRFRDLLGAVARHPAMLFYLDNWLSAKDGVKVPGGAGSGGLNENYARELMELHTLGVDGGYSQRDVTELARVLTGWTLAPRRGRGFVFDARRHDEGAKTWMGQRVPGRGQDEGEWVLDQLARHPRTAQRIALKLAQTFVADQPDPGLVQAVAARFLKSDGDLRASVRELLLHPAARAPEQIGAQFKTPQRFVLSMLRATAITPEDWQPTIQALRALGQPLYGCITPDGYKPTREAWLDPEALAKRADLAGRLAQRAQLGAEAGDRLLATLGPAIGAATRKALQAEPPRLRAALLLGSPDFQNA